jgi:predicted  nucleic acid-binding Zn-ribbon protein
MRRTLLFTLLVAVASSAPAQDKQSGPAAEKPKKVAPTEDRQPQRRGRRFRSMRRGELAAIRAQLREELTAEIHKAVADLKAEPGGKRPEAKTDARETVADLERQLAEARDRIAELEQQVKKAMNIAQVWKTEGEIALAQAKEQAALAKDQAAKALAAERRLAEEARKLRDAADAERTQAKEAQDQSRKALEALESAADAARENPQGKPPR